MNGVDEVRAVNIFHLRAGAADTYIFVYHVFTIFSDPFNESFLTGLLSPQVFEFWVSEVIGCFVQVRIYMGTIGALTAG